MKNTTTNKNGTTAIYVRRSVNDKDKGNNSLVHYRTERGVHKVRR